MNNQNKKIFSVKTLTMSAIFTALITVLTMFVSVAIPGGHGYIHLGDSMIYACAWALGGPLAGVASALGSILADFFLGYLIYIPATLVIKFLMGYVCFLIMKAFKYRFITSILAMIAAALIMLLGYTLYEYILVRIIDPVTFLNNLVQAVGGVVTGAILIFVLDKINAFTPYITWKANKANERN